MFVHHFDLMVYNIHDHTLLFNKIKMEDFWNAMSWLIVVIIIGCIYVIPSYVSRGRIRFWQVFWINILLGRSVIWWVVALVIALDKSNKKVEEKNKSYKNKRKSFLKKEIKIPDHFKGFPIKKISKLYYELFESPFE